MKPVIFALFLASCGSSPRGPVEPVWGKQPCDHCAMLLSDPLPAAQALLPDGSRKFFDDVGCLAAYLERSPAPGAHAWVHDPAGTQWIDAFSARYGAGHVTPMDYGFLAAREGVSFAELTELVVAKSRARSAEAAP